MKTTNEQDVPFLQECWNCRATFLGREYIPQLSTCDICGGKRKLLTDAGEEIKELLEFLGVLKPEQEER